MDFNVEVKKLDKYIIETTLKITNGSLRDSAKILGIKRTTLCEKCKEYKLKLLAYSDPSIEEILREHENDRRTYQKLISKGSI